MKPSWIIDSLKVGHFVSEELHQWSASDTTNTKEKGLFSERSLSSELSYSLIYSYLFVLFEELFEAPKRWRVRLKQENKRGAFEGWNVILYVNKKREKGLSKVLSAGGAHLFSSSPPFTNLPAAVPVFPIHLR